jgi:hypothetical protein
MAISFPKTPREARLLPSGHVASAGVSDAEISSKSEIESVHSSPKWI